MQSIRTVDYFSAIKRKRILIHATTWMNPDDIALSKKKKKKKTPDTERQILFIPLIQGV